MTPYRVWARLKYATIEKILPTREEAIAYRNTLLNQFEVVAVKVEPINGKA